MSPIEPQGVNIKTAPVDIPQVKASDTPHNYISRDSLEYFHHKMTTPTTKLSMVARSLLRMFDDLSLDEILYLERIMVENSERDVDCWLVDQITNWVYEDTEVLMPVSEAYRLVKLGIFNE